MCILNFYECFIKMMLMLMMMLWRWKNKIKKQRITGKMYKNSCPHGK